MLTSPWLLSSLAHKLLFSVPLPSGQKIDQQQLQQSLKEVGYRLQEVRLRLA